MGQHHDLSGADLHQPFRVGTHANRPASPSQGDWYYESDTKHLFRCDVDGAWADATSPSADNTDDLGASDKRWANAYIVGLGRKNLVINGSGIVNQRVSAYTLVKDEYGFGPDKFAGMATGTAVSAGTLGQTAAANCGRTGYGFKFSGVTLTGTGILYLRTRIESKDAIWLKNQVASFQAKVYHDVGSAINYTIYVKKAASADDFSSTTAVGNSGAISVASATATTIKYESISMGDCSNGIEIEIKIECGAITTKNFELTEMQMEMGSKGSEIEQQYHSNPVAPSITTLTSGSGTYMVPKGVRWLRVKMVGGGGGGGSSCNDASNDANNGAAGGDTTFGTNFLVLDGGGGGSGGKVGESVPAAEGGGLGGSTGTVPSGVSGFFMRGGDGGGAGIGTASYRPGGSGGNSAFGGGGGRNGSAGGTNTGGGGAGGGNVPNGYLGSGGGAGQYGEVILPDPDATYAYAVGAGGAGGGAGTGGAAGGNGGSGVIIIEEHYGY